MIAILSIDNHKVISWNDLYSSPHWTTRKTMADEIHTLIKSEATGQEIPHFDNPVRINITAGKVRLPIDPDNLCSKLYIDGLVEAGVIDDDNYNLVMEVTTKSVKSAINYIEIEITDDV